MSLKTFYTPQLLHQIEIYGLRAYYKINNEKNAKLVFNTLCKSIIQKSFYNCIHEIYLKIYLLNCFQNIVLGFS